MQATLGALVALSLLPGTRLPAQTPSDDEILRGLEGVPVLTWRGAQQRVGYANVDKVTTVNTIRRGERAQALTPAPRDLAGFTYTVKGTRRTLDDFMAQMNVVGLIVVTDGRIVFERYGQGHTADTRWTSFSVAKSVTSLLYGAAIKDGHVKSLDEPIIKYVPELAGTSYDGVTLRHLLQMSSGVAWNGDPSDPKSDVSQLSRLNREGGFRAQVAYMGQRPRTAPPGQRFNYNTGETDLAGAALRAAVGKTLSEYLSDRIWRPFGMESDGYWITMRGSDLERGGCCISATLRDYARIGLVPLNDGVGPDGTRVLPEGWIRESTLPSAATERYGMYWWLRPNGRYFASGVFGQHIEIAPAERTVVAIQSYWPEAFNDELLEHNDTFVDALIAAVRGPS